jgi:hypothetical protein
MEIKNIMCIRTVEGEDIVESSLRTIDGEYSLAYRNISGLTQVAPELLNLNPTTTYLTGPASDTYTTPTGCVYIEVYVTGAGGGGAGGNTSTADVKYGAGGGGGDVSYGIFQAGSYSYELHSGAAGGAFSGNGSSAAQYSTFGILKASGGDGGSEANLTVNSGTGKWSNDTSVKNSLIEFGYQRSLPAGFHPSNGGYNLFNGGFGRSIRTDTDNDGDEGVKDGGGGGGGVLGAGGSAGAPSSLLVIEYY